MSARIKDRENGLSAELKQGPEFGKLPDGLELRK